MMPLDQVVLKWTDTNFQEHLEFQHLQCGEQLLPTKDPDTDDDRPGRTALLTPSSGV